MEERPAQRPPSPRWPTGRNLADAIQDLNYEPPTPEDLGRERATVFEHLKEDVNRFLWSKLPPSMTMGEADHVACQIHDMLMAAWGDEESEIRMALGPQAEALRAAAADLSKAAVGKLFATFEEWWKDNGPALAKAVVSPNLDMIEREVEERFFAKVGHFIAAKAWEAALWRRP